MLVVVLNLLLVIFIVMLLKFLKIVNQFLPLDLVSGNSFDLSFDDLGSVCTEFNLMLATV